MNILMSILESIDLSVSDKNSHARLWRESTTSHWGNPFPYFSGGPVVVPLASSSLASMLLDRLLTVVSLRVREELQALVTTLYQPAATRIIPTLVTTP